MWRKKSYNIEACSLYCSAINFHSEDVIISPIYNITKIDLWTIVRFYFSVSCSIQLILQPISIGETYFSSCLTIVILPEWDIVPGWKCSLGDRSNVHFNQFFERYPSSFMFSHDIVSWNLEVIALQYMKVRCICKLPGDSVLRLVFGTSLI